MKRTIAETQMVFTVQSTHTHKVYRILPIEIERERVRTQPHYFNMLLCRGIAQEIRVVFGSVKPKRIFTLEMALESSFCGLFSQVRIIEFGFQRIAHCFSNYMDD